MFTFPLTVDLFTFLFGAGVAVLLAWFPYVNTWFANLNAELRKACLLGFSILLTVAIGLSSCWDWYVFIECGKSGFLHLALTWASFMFGNLLLDNLLPKSAKVRALLSK